MYKFITTVKQLVVSLHFISEDLTYDAAHKESNSFGTQSVCYPRRLYDAHKEGNSIGSPKPNACVIPKRLTSFPYHAFKYKAVKYNPNKFSIA